MNVTSINLFKSLFFMVFFVLCPLANAEHITIETAKQYPYKNLIDRTDVVKVFYITNEGNQQCRVEVVLNKMKWISAEKQVNKEVFNKSLLANCLSKEAAEQILLQTFLQFGRGL